MVYTYPIVKAGLVLLRGTASLSAIIWYHQITTDCKSVSRRHFQFCTLILFFAFFLFVLSLCF